MIFRSAIRRLTITFTLIQLLLLGAFAIAIYTFVTGTFDFDAIASDGVSAVRAAEQGFATLRTGLIVSYSGFIVLAPLTGYVMARATLRPVRISFKAQQRFVDDASHEFRTPLSILQGEIELALSRARKPAEYRRVLTGSLEVVGGLTNLTDSLLLLARGHATDLADTFVDVELGDLVRTCAAQRNPTTSLRTRGAPNIDLNTLTEARIVGSPDLLSRALLNVLDNAVKFTPPEGSVAVSVLVSATRATIQVRDTGAGMGADAIQHAFDRFWRGDHARTHGGHGLGLALVQQICNAHGGKAAITSLVGEGTTVTLAFPIAPVTGRH